MVVNFNNKPLEDDFLSWYKTRVLRRSGYTWLKSETEIEQDKRNVVDPKTRNTLTGSKPETWTGKLIHHLIQFLRKNLYSHIYHMNFKFYVEKYNIKNHWYSNVVFFFFFIWSKILGILLKKIGLTKIWPISIKLDQKSTEMWFN